MSTFNRYEATSAGTIYTANSTDVIIGILVSNTHAADTAQVDLVLSGTSLATNLKIPVGGSVELVQGKIVAESGDALVLTVDAGTVAVYVSVLDSAS
jgi:hypothetical protein